MNNQEYRQANALSQSDLKTILKSKKHYVNRDKLRHETASMKLGTAFHAAILEPMKFKENYLQLPNCMPNGEAINRRKKAHKEYLEQIALENPTKITLTDDEMDSLTGMLNSILEHDLANSLFKDGLAETVSFWQNEGQNCKGKADYFHAKHPLLGDRVLVELKTAQDGSHVAFSREVVKRNLDFQAAWYQQGFNADRVITVVVETKFPYPIAVYSMDLWLDSGRNKIKKAFRLLKEFENDGIADGYTRSIEDLPVPDYVASMSDE